MLLVVPLALLTVLLASLRLVGFNFQQQQQQQQLQLQSTAVSSISTSRSSSGVQLVDLESQRSGKSWQATPSPFQTVPWFSAANSDSENTRPGPLSCNHESARATSDPGSEGPGIQGRKFLLMVEGNEQLSKGRKHFAEAMVMARRLNRTLILPHVGLSVIDPDKSLPFCTYFDVDRLADYVSWVTQEWYAREVSKLLRETHPNRRPRELSTFSMVLAGRQALVQERVTGM